MDSRSEIQEATKCSLPLSSIGRENVNSTDVLSSKKRCLPTSIHQIWSLPDSVIYYITMKPSSSKGYQKLIKICKYFFWKNPIIVVEGLYYGRHWNAKYLNEFIYFYPFNINAKLWITEMLFIWPDPYTFIPTMSSLFVPKIYQCDAKILHLYEQIISMKEFICISSNVVTITLNHVMIKNRDGTAIPFEQFVNVLPLVKNFNIDFNPIHPKSKDNFILKVSTKMSSKTMIELLNVKHFVQIDNLEFSNIPECFDTETFYGYMKTNKHTNIKFTFYLRFLKHTKIVLKKLLMKFLKQIIMIIDHPIFAFTNWMKREKQK